MSDYIDTADVVALAETDGARCVLLVERAWPPYESHWALPGGHRDPGESALRTAVRELIEETAIAIRPEELTVLGVYDTPGRDPRGAYRTTVYRADLDDAPVPIAADDARAARWVRLAELDDLPVAFDHRSILRDALAQ